MSFKSKNPQAPRWASKKLRGEPLPPKLPEQSSVERLREREEARRHVAGSTTKEKNA